MRIAASIAVAALAVCAGCSASAPTGRGAAFIVVNDTGRPAVVIDCAVSTTSTSCDERKRLHLAPSQNGRLPFATEPPYADVAAVSGVWQQVRCLLIGPAPGRSGSTHSPVSFTTPLSAAKASSCDSFFQQSQRDRHLRQLAKRAGQRQHPTAK